MSKIRLDTADVWERLSSDLRRFIRRRVPNVAAADDLLQETFVRIHRGLSALVDEDRLNAWVYRIAHNVLTDYYRKSSPAFGVEASDVVAPADEDDSRSATGGAKWLAEIVDTLPEGYRGALRLSELEGLTQYKVAGRLGLTDSGAKSRIQRGRVLLKQAIQRCCRFDFDRRGNIVDCDPLPGQTICRDCGESKRGSAEMFASRRRSSTPTRGEANGA